jgi:signal transduction histidine kinase
VRVVAAHSEAHWSVDEPEERQNATRGRALEASANANDLLLGLTHDMRSPLSSILVLVERLRTGQSGPVTALQERQLGLVYSAAFGLAAAANDVLELSRGGARLVGAEPVPFSLYEVFRAVRGLVQPIAEDKRLVLRFSAPQDDQFVGHPAAIQRVLLNLATNALKFTNVGVVKLEAERRDGQIVRFTVEDSGEGLSAELYAQLAAGDGAVSLMAGSAFSSAGLGLANCQQLLALMDSRLSACPVQPIGTRFEFSLSLPAA